jgi:hypothetical protein
MVSVGQSAAIIPTIARTGSQKAGGPGYSSFIKKRIFVHCPQSFCGL